MPMLHAPAPRHRPRDPPVSGPEPRYAAGIASLPCRHEKFAVAERSLFAMKDYEGSGCGGGCGGGSCDGNFGSEGDAVLAGAQQGTIFSERHGQRQCPVLLISDSRERLCSYRPWGFSLVSTSAMLLFLAFLVQLSSAAMVPFQNCLPANYLYNTDPVLLQWVPLYVDAVFDTQNSSHALRVTMYGNVTGTLTTATLPPWNSSDWNNPNMTDGKILREPNPNSAAPKLTTLHSVVDVLTYEPWESDADFCANALTNATCPLGPIFNTTPIAEYYLLPSVSMSNNFYSSYAFTSFSPTFIIKYGDDAVTTIGCVSATVTPDLGGLAWMLKFLPLLMLLAVGFATIFAAIYSPWGSNDIFHWSSNFGRDPDLLRLVTPGFGDCLQYIQFIVLSGSLTLNYPGFYQPIVSQGSWSSLMFNESFVSKAPGLQNVYDGIYVANGTYGLQNLAQLVGMGQVQDIWAGMMVWLLVIIAATFVLTQLAFGVQFVYRFIKKEPEEDLRSKNFPFSVGNVIRIVFNYFLLPIVSLSTFQLVVASDSPAYTVALAVVTLALIIGFACWLLYLIVSTKPRAVLFDDLQTVLLYGPLYNTYSDEAAAFALIPLLLTFIRGIAVGAVQPAGIAQVVLLAICEVIQILTIHAFRPFHTQSWMNLYHTLFSALRLVTILLMIAFIPSLGVTDGPKGWIGYVILLIHAGVLVLVFFLNSIQTTLEVIARMAGAGGDDYRGTRGGLAKIFGMRQLSRRMSRHRAAPSRQSVLSTTAILEPSEETAKGGYIMPSGRVRSESAGSIGVFVNGQNGHRSSTALDSNSIDAVFLPPRNLDSGASSLGPATPGEVTSNFSFLPSSSGNRKSGTAVTAAEASDPYYRPPRRIRRPTLDRDNMSSSAAERARASWGSNDWTQRVPAGPLNGPAELEDGLARGVTPAPFTQPAVTFSPRTDYSTREVDFYYGVRGQRLNSDVPGRKLGTGPADPTGPMASAAGWFRTLLGGKRKEKSKGFEVVRSARMPPAMQARGGDLSDEAPPEGIPVAMGVIRNGPIESDDEEEERRKKKKNARADHASGAPGETDLLDADGNPQEENVEDSPEISRVSDVPPLLPSIDAGESIRLPSRVQSKASRHETVRDAVDIDSDRPPLPDLPRKSSRRHSALLPQGGAPSADPGSSAVASDQQHLAPADATSRLPFERSNSQKRSSASSLVATEDFSQATSSGGQEERPTSYGFVHQGSVRTINPDQRQVDLLGSSAEVVDERR